MIPLLIAKIQANLARNKAIKMVDKIQPYSSSSKSIMVLKPMSIKDTPLLQYHNPVFDL